MHTGLDLLVLTVAVGGAWLAAAFAILGYFRARPASQLLTAQGAAQLLRAETDIVRGAVEDQKNRRTRSSGDATPRFENSRRKVGQR